VGIILTVHQCMTDHLVLYRCCKPTRCKFDWGWR